MNWPPSEMTKFRTCQVGQSVAEGVLGKWSRHRQRPQSQHRDNGTGTREGFGQTQVWGQVPRWE